MATVDISQPKSGLISKTLDWILHPSNTDTDPMDWLAGIVVLLCIAWLWSRIVKLTEEVPSLIEG